MTFSAKTHIINDDLTVAFNSPTTCTATVNIKGYAYKVPMHISQSRNHLAKSYIEYGGRLTQRRNDDNGTSTLAIAGDVENALTLDAESSDRFYSLFDSAITEVSGIREVFSRKVLELMEDSMINGATVTITDRNSYITTGTIKSIETLFVGILTARDKRLTYIRSEDIRQIGQSR